MKILTSDDMGTTKVTSVLNIDMLVGNGFDIRLLKHFGVSHTTTYTDFFQWEMKNKSMSEMQNNVILRAMKEANLKKSPNWSDLEQAIKEYMKHAVTYIKDQYSFDEINDMLDIVVEKVISSVEEIQRDFSKFLLETVSPELLSETNRLANQSINDSTFASSLYNGDVSAPSINSMRGFAIDVNRSEANGSLHFCFDEITHDFDMFNWNVFNLNYTYLLDNFLAFGVDVFEPHKRQLAKTNFVFYPKTHRFSARNKGKNSYSDYLQLSLFHPHGQMSIPASMLFGVDTIDDFYDIPIADESRYSSVYHKEQRLSKRYLAQDDLKYRNMLENGLVYIAFGTSYGESDQWWWNQIFAGMSEDVNRKDLIPVFTSDSDGDDISKHRKYVKDLLFKRELICYEYVPGQDKVDPMTNAIVAERTRKNVIKKIKNLYDRAKNDARCDTENWKEFDDCLENQIFVVPYNEQSELATFGLPNKA